MKTVKLQAATPYLAAFVIFYKDGKIACVLRENTGWNDGNYCLPSGKVEENESAMAAAIREAKEEAGIDLKSANLKPALVVHRNSPDSDWIDVLFEAVDWEGEPYNAEPHIHKELAWLDVHNLPENMVPAVRFYTEQFLAGNHYAELGWEE
ncbi:MAG TPA: NUDIX domain-containing protein [Candidatus Saccharimonadales bacterium]|nr:NUDIX domain-containing protein [Candidatus Saccharimonadales bacterium]